MKPFILLLFLASSLFAETLTLVGLSGNRYAIPFRTDHGVDCEKLFSTLYFGNTTSGDTLRVKNAGRSLIAVAGGKSVRLDGKPLPYSVQLTRADGRFWLKTDSLAPLLSALSTYGFTFAESSRTVSVHKKGAESKKSPVSASTAKSSTGVIVIDPGHGGKDPGAIGSTGVYEKDIVLAIAKKTATYIKKNSSYAVYLTREGDAFIPLRDRTTYANKRRADLFVSIHCNAAEKNDTASGYKIYFLSDAKNATDERIAVFENAVMNLEESGGESDLLQSVLKDMINNEYLKESQELSADIERSFRTALPPINPQHTGVGQANFYVLNGAQMPSVLVETAFISNKQEEKLLRDDQFQTKIAEALGRSIVAFRKKQGKRDE